MRKNDLSKYPNEERKKCAKQRWRLSNLKDKYYHFGYESSIMKNKTNPVNRHNKVKA